MFKMRSKKWKISGQIIVETAVLLPAIILWIVWLTFFMIFMLDMAVVKGECIRLADEGAMLWNKDGNLETGEYKISEGRKSLLEGFLGSGGKNKVLNRGRKRLGSRINNRIVLTSCGNVRMTVGSKNAISSAEVYFCWPFSGKRITGVSGLGFTGKARAPVNNWEDFLRIAKARVHFKTDKNNVGFKEGN